MKFYRYEYHSFANSKYPNPALHVIEFDLVKETPKGYWISGKLSRKWIPKGNARYAHTTKDAALRALIKRTKNRISILKYQLQESEIILIVAEGLKTKRNERPIKL